MSHVGSALKYLVMICLCFLATGCKKDVEYNGIVASETIENIVEDKKIYENVPDIEMSGDSILEVKINNQESYETFIKQIKEYKNCSILFLDLLGSNTVVYLDEILSQNNFVILEIKNGGILSVKDAEACQKANLRDLSLKYMFQIDNCVLDVFSSLNTVLLWIDPSFRTQDFNLFQYKEWENLMSIKAKDNGDNVAIYIMNEEGVTYSSYELYKDADRRNPYVVISIRRMDNKTECEILEIPNDITERINKDDGCRIMLRDVNFDGYKDILYLGDNNNIDLFHQCIGFLWDEEAGKYELCKSLPAHFGFIDSERKRLTYYDHLSIYDETYYIYEFDDGIFIQKRLEIEFKEDESTLTEIDWNYYEKEELLETLVLEYSNGEVAHYTFYGRDNNIIEGEFPKEKMYSQLGKQYFPEFDFYFFG